MSVTHDSERPVPTSWEPLLGGAWSHHGGSSPGGVTSQFDLKRMQDQTFNPLLWNEVPAFDDLTDITTIPKVVIVSSSVGSAGGVGTVST